MVGNYLDQEFLCSLLAVPFIITYYLWTKNLHLESRNDIYITFCWSSNYIAHMKHFVSIRHYTNITFLNCKHDECM